MGKSIFIDIKERELETYIFELGQGRYEIREKKKYPVSDRYDFSVDGIPEDIEDAYLSLPLSSLNFRIIELPFSDKDRIREVLPFELNGMILGGSDKVVFDNVIVGTSENKYQVLAVYIDKTVIGKILERLKLANIDPKFITSIELREVLKDFNLASLLTPPDLKDDDRIALAIEEIKAPTLNLRRDEFSYTRDVEKTKKSLRITAVLAILLVLILISDLLLNIISTKQEIASLKNEMRKMYQGLFPEEKKITNELYQLKSHMKELKDKEEYLIGLSPLDILLNLSQVNKQGVVFNEVTADKGNIILKGEAPSLSNIQQLKDELNNFFDDVNIADSKASTQGNMLFTITAQERKV